MLQDVYFAAWHLPAVTVLSVTVLFLVLARRVPFIIGYSVLFGWLILLDAWANGALSPIPQDARRPFEILFVVVGDWRYFLLLEHYGGNGLTLRGLVRSIALASVTPLLTLGYILTQPGELNMRLVFLVYEVIFFLLALVVLFAVLPRWQKAGKENHSFLKALTCFELLQYGLWATADVLLVGGQSWAMTMRLTANLFYYSLFVPFVWWRSPDSPGRRRSLVPIAAVGVATFALSFVSLATRTPAEPVMAIEPAAALSFMEGEQRVSSVSLTKLVQSLRIEQVAAFDPYYGRDKRWRAVSIENVLMTGFGREPSALVEQEFVLRASDGFAAYFPGKRLLEGGAYIAIEDLDVPAWEPIGPRQDNPGPFYLVWAKPGQQNLDTHARPWQLASIEIVSFDSQFPNVRPHGANINPSAERGFQTFRVQCLPCHAINRAGGKVGPELNVPRNILEYRDPVVLRAFIKDPTAFRYTVMPAHPNMTSGELDDLIAYFSVMKNQKNDKDAVKAVETR
jgi:hypothetical protein